MRRLLGPGFGLALLGLLLAVGTLMAPASSAARAPFSAQSAAQLLQRVQGRWYGNLDPDMNIRVIYEVTGTTVTVVQVPVGLTQKVGTVVAEDLDFVGGELRDTGGGRWIHTGFGTTFDPGTNTPRPRNAVSYAENWMSSTWRRPIDMMTIGGMTFLREPAGHPPLVQEPSAPSRPATPQAVTASGAQPQPRPATAPASPAVSEAEALARAQAAERANAELAAQRAATDRLNAEMASQDAATVARNRARAEEFARQQAEHRRQVAAAEAEAERIRREDAAAKADYERRMQAWRKAVEDCKAGKHAACANPM